MKNITKLVQFIISILLLLTGIGVGGYFLRPVETEYISVSWSYNFSDIEELTQRSDLIALVKVKDLVEYEEVSAGPFSTYEVEVKEPIYNCKAGDKVKIFMTGGEKGNKRIEVKGDPLLDKGQEFLIFAKKNTKRADTYSILGGPQGRLAYKNGNLYSLNHVNNNTRITEEEEQQFSIDVKEISLNNMMEEISTYLKQ